MKSSALHNLQTMGAVLFFSAGLLSLDAKSADMASAKSVVDAAILPVQQAYGIPGIAVGIVVDGKEYVFNYGLASKADNKPVTNATLFEIGSISKTFTATMASLAQVRGKLALTDKVSDHLVSLKGSEFGNTTLLNLATHTTGGLPLQVPDEIESDEQLMNYLKNWKPDHVQGSHRTYSNISAGLLGVIAAKSMQADFTSLMQQQIFPAFGMANSYLVVPQEKMTDYAQGYSKTDAPVRLSSDILAAEAYGVKTTASDLMQFLKANMGETKLAPEFTLAVMNTHTGYYQTGAMTQSLMWELYPYPVDVTTLTAGSSKHMVFDATPVTTITPPMIPSASVLIHKTGATNGFGAYLAFVPQKKIGIVILANKNYPNEARIRAAQQIFSRLE